VLIACGHPALRPDYVPFNKHDSVRFSAPRSFELPKLPRSLAVIGAGVRERREYAPFSPPSTSPHLIEPRSHLHSTSSTRKLTDE